MFDLAINFKIQRLPFTIRSVNIMPSSASDRCCSSNSNWTRFRKFVPPEVGVGEGIGKSSSMRYTMELIMP